MILFAAAALAAGAFAVPAKDSATSTNPISNQLQLDSALSALGGPAKPNFAADYTSLLSAIKPASRPKDGAELASRVASARASYPSDPFSYAAQLSLDGVASIDDFGDLNAYGICNGFLNLQNPRPRQNIYPKSRQDAPYSVPELSLRSAIFIPKSFTYGKKTPVLLLPGTGVFACSNFFTNYFKLLSQTDYADPVFVNVPNAMLDDQQINAEYIAYATNYIASISGRNVTTVSWSAGSIAGQWARKYWPSTRAVTTSANHVSADYHGTVFVPLICPPGIPCAPAVLQQNFNATWIQTLRANGGDSAYVPTTSCWTIYDEIVQPQIDPVPGASARVGDRNGAPVLNAQLQDICGFNPLTGPAAGPNLGHEAALYSSVCYALISDAIKNGGVGSIERSGAKAECSKVFADGLDIPDNLVTHSNIPIAGAAILAYPRKVTSEPAIRAYAQRDAPQ